MRLERFFSLVGGPRARSVLVGMIAAWLVWQRRMWSAAMLVSACGGMGAINSGIKAAVRRQRPKGIPRLRQAGGYSFPSGHSSGSAVFFGALSYLVWRRTRHRTLAAAALGASAALAAAIGRSRVTLKAHHGSDVLAGLGAGAVWLALIIRLFARRLEGEYQAGPAAEQGKTSLPTRSIVLITNATSGRAKKTLEDVHSCLKKEGFHVAEEIPIEEIDRLQHWIGMSCSDPPLVVAAGGDGTIGSVAGYLVDTESVLGILPAGTSNDIARSLDIPLKIEDAVRLLRTGTPAPVDIGRFDASGEKPRYFLHAATAGINVAFARMATQSSFRKRLGKLTYVAAGLAALRRLEPFTCDVTIDDKDTSLCLLQICVVNAPVFGGLLHLELPHSRIDDSHLTVLAIDDMPLFRLVLTAVRILIGRQAPVRGIRMYHVQKIAVRPKEPLSITLDGEIAATIPGNFSLRAGALRVVRPRVP